MAVMDMEDGRCRLHNVLPSHEIARLFCNLGSISVTYRKNSVHIGKGYMRIKYE